MAIVRCEQGHFYDDQKTRTCPICSRGQGNVGDDRTVWKELEQEESSSIHMIRKTTAADPDLTIGFFSAQNGNDFVVGWLVCIEGPDKGRDYRLHHGFNSIGRSAKDDVTLENDLQLSRLASCSIVYEEKKNLFYLTPEDGQIVYYKGEFLEKPIQLSSHDTFEIGNSTLEFIAFCEGERRWEK